MEEGKDDAMERGRDGVMEGGRDGVIERREGVMEEGRKSVIEGEMVWWRERGKVFASPRIWACIPDPLPLWMG